ncbi:MAG: FAD-dependent oxidoreductase [Deltaproteobacteria bacterium]|nr:FAD-dependent oxidoreductase [Deltaproteobacteria bacterium]
MPLITCQSRVAAVRTLTHDVRELTFALTDPPAFPFLAGQYVAFRAPAPDKPKGASRLYSLCSPPSEEGTLRVVYNFVGGPGTAYLHTLNVGDAVEFKGPSGKFLFQTESTRDALFVATGTGIGPFRSMLLEYLQTMHQRKLTVLWSVRQERDLYYQDEFRALEQRYPHFRFCMTLTRPTGDWQGLRGRVTAIFPEHFPSVDNLEVYVCGHENMITQMQQLCDARGGCPFYREIYY